MPTTVFQPGDCAWMSAALQSGHLSLRQIMGGDYGTFRPVCIAAGGVEWLALGPHPDAHHAAMLVLHLIVAGLVGAVSYSMELGWRRAVFAAMLFVAAPARLDVALQLHGRCDLLVTALLLVFVVALRRRTALALLVALLAGTLACLTKETALVIVPLLLAGEGWSAIRARPARIALLVLPVFVVFVARAMVLGGASGAYITELVARMPGIRGVPETIALAMVPFKEITEFAKGAKALLPGSWGLLRALLGLGLGASVLWLALRVIPRGRIRSVGLALVVGGALAGVGLVNSREAYLPAAGICLMAASCPIPRASALRMVGVALVFALILATAFRTEVWLRGFSLAARLHAAAVTVARSAHADRMVLLGAPDDLDGTVTSPVSECWAAIEPDAPIVVAGARGSTRRGMGPTTMIDGNTIRLASNPAEFLLMSAYCQPGFAADEIPSPVVVRCDRGTDPTIDVTKPAQPARESFAVWLGGDEVRFLW